MYHIGERRCDYYGNEDSEKMVKITGDPSSKFELKRINDLRLTTNIPCIKTYSCLYIA